MNVNNEIYAAMQRETHSGVSLNDIVGGGNPQIVGEQAFDTLLRFDVLKPDSNVFELGCGCGRSAIPIAKYQNTGSYIGVDIMLPLIDFCCRHISSKYSNTSFYVIDEKNPLYDCARGNAPARTIASVCHSMDLIVAFSVFTHFDETMVRRFLGELYSGLTDGGSLVITAFLLNEHSRLNIRSGYSNLSFQPDALSIDILTTNGPLSAVAFDENHFRKIIIENNFEISAIQYGHWSGGTNMVYQDTLVLRKPLAYPAGFNPGLYLRANPDVSSTNHNPYHHWLNYGRFEGRKLFP